MKNWLSHQIGRALLVLSKVGVVTCIVKIAKWLGIQKFLIPGHEIRKAINLAQPGDLILIRSFGESSSFLIGAGYTHVAMKINDHDFIVDSTAQFGVAKRDILELFSGTARVAIMRPKFLTASQVNSVVQRALGYESKNIPYDYTFASGTEAMYCSEFMYHCINDIVPGAMNLRKRYGISTITPQDYYQAGRLFELIYEYR